MIDLLRLKLTIVKLQLQLRLGHAIQIRLLSLQCLLLECEHFLPVLIKLGRTLMQPKLALFFAQFVLRIIFFIPIRAPFLMMLAAIRAVLHYLDPVIREVILSLLTVVALILRLGLLFAILE